MQYATYADGDADGVSAADIRRGVDRRLTPDERLGDLFPGVAFALPDDVPDVGQTRGGAGRDPVRIGRSRILTFTPIGTATSGTLYVRGPQGRGKGVPRGHALEGDVVTGGVSSHSLFAADSRCGDVWIEPR